jgi:uncharacterized protein
MSGSLHTWYSLHDLETLGVRRVVLSGEIELRRLSRLAGLLHSDAGSVRASLRVRQRRDDRLIVELEYAATLQLLCQRCLEPISHRVAERIDLAVIESTAASASVPAGCEPFELDDGRLLPVQLIEDELIVAIPLVPKHARIDDCGSLARQLGVPAAGPEPASAGPVS